MSSQSFKTVHTSVRPTRVAVLVDKNDIDWQHTCLRIIEFYSRLWGGAYNIIVPTDGQSIDERFWTLLEVFDPDHIYRYAKSGRDLALSRPDEYAKILTQHVDAYLADGNPNDPERPQRVRGEVDRGLRSAWIEPRFGITEELHAALKIRVSPFYFEQYVVEAGAVTSDSGIPFPLTDITKIAPSTEHPDHVSLVTVPADSVPRLWFAAATGLISDGAQKAFGEAGIAPEAFDFDEDTLGNLIEFVVTGSIEARGVSGGSKSAFSGLNRTAPFRISMLELGLYRSTKYQYWSEPFLLIAGNTVEDFCLYYCLSRMRDRVCWVLPSITERVLNPTTSPATRAEENFLFQLHAEEFSTSSSHTFVCASASLDSQLDDVIEELNRLGHRRFPSITRAASIRQLIRFPLVAYERDSFQRDVVVQLLNGRSIAPFATPKPKHFDPVHPSEHRYIAQLSIAREGTPKHSELGTWIISDHRLLTNGVRIGKDGPAYSCPNIGYFGGDIDTVLIRPYLNLPALHTIIEIIARTQQYECLPSDKGIYSEESIRKWGGLSEIALFLRAEPKRALLADFVSRASSKKGEGVYLSEDKRRYLDFAAIHRRIGNDAITLVDDLIKKEILYRGFIFRCSYCRSSSWFAVSELTQEFTCRRCSRAQVYTHSHWKMPEEPAWFYKLDELVYQGFQHGMTASLLALDYLRNTSAETFNYTTDREFWKSAGSKPEFECDLIFVRDGVLGIGEAKTEATLGSSTTEENTKIRKYKQLAASLSIRELVFATLGESWGAVLVERVTKAFADMPYLRLRFLDAGELLGG